MAHREPIEVVFADVDMMGHVNNATYFTYFETARTRYFLRLRGEGPPFRPESLNMIVAKASCEYKRALRWGERVEVVVWPSRLGRTSFLFNYEIRDERGEVAAVGETVQVVFDYDKNEKTEIPSAFRAALEAEERRGRP